MKNTHHFLAVAATMLMMVFAGFACSPKIAVSSGVDTVAFLDSPSNGLVSLNSYGYGNNPELADSDAIKRAFETVIFRGVPAFTALSTPLIPSEGTFKQKNPGFLDRFIDEGLYERFVTESNPPREGADKRRVEKQITINYATLRKYLEESGMTRKFGY